ncbi:transcription factor HES-7.1-A-like [Syngnathus scovelli]|uniref:transcription factor HES-7.1-A-like n=1 Tax=Syngnathus scovelli TaxID=161590 RepID=UPI00210F3A58|nr:transcription factor HES-7.1-A-like [Syngnathus scovelli]
MMMSQHREHANTDKKSLKPLVERRRRERINRSLENLKTLLLTSQLAGGGRRLEKAEILEHTVYFLQQHVNKGNMKQVLHSYQHGFSSCLQRAAHFLHSDGKAMGLADSASASSSSASSASASSASASSSSSWPSCSPPTIGGPSRVILFNNTPQKRPSMTGSLWRPWS